MGITRKDLLVEVQRSDIVAQYIGATAKLTAEKVKSADGGVLFIDEAYTLVSTSERDFGKEAIETIMRYLLPSPSPSQPCPVFVFAGYKKEMKNFLNQNPGLSRRIENIIHLDDFSDEDLAAIIRIKLHRKKMKFPFQIQLAEMMSTIPARIKSKYNGSLAGKIIDAAIREQESSLGSNPSKEELLQLESKHFVEGINFLKEHFLKIEDDTINSTKMVDASSQTDI